MFPLIIIFTFTNSSSLFRTVMNIKTEPKQPNQKPKQIDISKQPYDKYLQNLKHWKILASETIIKTLDYFISYKYQCLSQMKYISEKVSAFHRQICKINDRGYINSTEVEIESIYFQKVIELKEKFRKLEKKGCFSGEKKIKSKLQEFQKQKKNLVNVNVVVPDSLIQSEKDQYHRTLICELYRSFVTYYPQSHADQTLNSRVVQFLKELYTQMKKKCFYLKQKEFFSYEMEKLCQKLKNQKYLENKKLMLTGEISIKEIVMNRISVFQNYSVKRKEQEEMMKILRESQIASNQSLPIQSQNPEQKINHENEIAEDSHNLQYQYMQFDEPHSFGNS